jgi:hypothetical protein
VDNSTILEFDGDGLVVQLHQEPEKIQMFPSAFEDESEVAQNIFQRQMSRKSFCI